MLGALQRCKDPSLALKPLDFAAVQGHVSRGGDGKRSSLPASSAQGSSRSPTLSPPVLSGVCPNSPHFMQRTAPYDAVAVTNVLPLLGCTRTNAVFLTGTPLEAGSKVHGEYHTQLQLHRSSEMGCQYSYGFWGRIQDCNLYSFQKCYGFAHDHLWSGSCFLFHPE